MYQIECAYLSETASHSAKVGGESIQSCASAITSYAYFSNSDYLNQH